jgi:hypothetical protein
MPEIDLGSLTVSLTLVPRGLAGKPTPFKTDSYTRIDDARAVTSSGLLEPSYLPGNLAFFDAAILKAPEELTATTYVDKINGSSCVLIQSPVSQYQAGEGGEPIVYAAGDSIAQTSVGGLPAAVVEIAPTAAPPGGRTTLLWVQHGSLLQLSGSGIPLNELTKIAASVA